MATREGYVFEGGFPSAETVRGAATKPTLSER